MIDGSFGSASEDFLNFETVLLTSAGIGVTPFARKCFCVDLMGSFQNKKDSKIWYRMNKFNDFESKPGFPRYVEYRS